MWGVDTESMHTGGATLLAGERALAYPPVVSHHDMTTSLVDTNGGVLMALEVPLTLS